MEWKAYVDPIAFTDKIEMLLYKNEDKNSLFLGILSQIKSGRYAEYYLALAEENGEVLAVTLMTPPHPLQLIVFKENPVMLANLAIFLEKSNLKILGVIGDKVTAQLFAQEWAARTDATIALQMDEGLYRIDAVAKGIERSVGSWRIASQQNAELLEDWYLIFEKDTGIGTSTREEAATKIEQFLNNKEVYIWEVEEKVVSCMKKSRPSKHGITISFVFTPEKHRRQGYAKTLVAEVTEELLTEFDFAMLYTDLENSTSNKIYSEIGYEKIGNPVHLKFM